MNLVGLIIDWSAVQVCEGPPNFERRSRLVPTTPFLCLLTLGTVVGVVIRCSSHQQLQTYYLPRFYPLFLFAYYQSFYIVVETKCLLAI
jgi:hypothetical protein